MNLRRTNIQRNIITATKRNIKGKDPRPRLKIDPNPEAKRVVNGFGGPTLVTAVEAIVINT